MNAKWIIAIAGFLAATVLTLMIDQIRENAMDVIRTTKQQAVMQEWIRHHEALHAVKPPGPPFPFGP